MSESEGALEAGEIPNVAFKSDGTFFGNFFKGELETNNEQRPKQSSEAEKSHEGRQDNAELADTVPSDPATVKPPKSEGNNEGELQQKPTIPPLAVKSKPPGLILKPKKSIANVRLRPGAQQPKAKRSKGRASAYAHLHQYMHYEKFQIIIPLILMSPRVFV